MELNLDKILGINATTKIKSAIKLKNHVTTITGNNEFALTIKQNKLIIYIEPHNLSQLRRFEQIIIAKLGTEYNFNVIAWRPKQKSQLPPAITSSKTKLATSRIKPKKGCLQAVADKCRHKKLKDALLRFSHNLENNCD